MGEDAATMQSLVLRAFLVSALISVTYGSCVAKMDRYPGFSGTSGYGMVMVSGAKDSHDLEVSYDLKSLEANYPAGIHIHTGTTCDDADFVSNHFFATAVDPWTTTTATSDGNGDTAGKFNVNAGLNMCDVIGHVVVVHSSTARIACGVCYESCTASIEAYPGTSDGKYSSVAGSVSVTTATEPTSVWNDVSSSTKVDFVRNGVNLAYALTGLEPGVRAGLHIHTGTTCADADYVAGHFFATNLDPWGTISTATGAADFCGAATGEVVDAHNGLSLRDVYGHAVVVHDESGGRIGCGICKKATECGHRYDTCAAKLDTYPGYPGTLSPSGTVQVFGSPGSGFGFQSNISLAYDVEGLLASYGAPMHIHTGTTCTTNVNSPPGPSFPKLIAGHYFASPTDPWGGSRTSVTDGTGAATGTIADVHSGLSAAQSVGHAVVVHDGPNPIACGVCVPTCTATMSPYPGYAGSYNVAGTVKATATGMSLHTSTIELIYALTGAEPNAAGGLHIHTGTTCADANLVSGHYFATTSDPWTTTTGVANGVGDVSGTFPTVTAGLGFDAIVDHTIVVHDSAGARIGCGVCVPDSVTPPIATTSIDTCGDLKSVFQTNFCCGDPSKPLNEQIMSS